jgi:hypothetical protein
VRYEPFFQEAPKIYETDLDAYYRDKNLETLTIRYYDGIGLPIDDVLERSERSGQALKLYENAQALDPSWAQLKAFLVTDNTDQQLYIPDVFVCADFAAMLHNRAEMAGIKTAYVNIDFVSGPVTPIERKKERTMSFSTMFVAEGSS